LKASAWMVGKIWLRLPWSAQIEERAAAADN
jgi:hypothetical protein